MPEMMPTEIYNAAARAASLLTTSLNEALADCRAALAEHARVVGQEKLGQLDDLLAEFARRRVRIALSH